MHLPFKMKMIIIRAAIITPLRADMTVTITAATTKPDVCL